MVPDKIILKRSLFKKNGNRKKLIRLSSITSMRDPVTRMDGRKDYSEISPFVAVTKDSILKNSYEPGITRSLLSDLETYLVRGLDMREACVLSGMSHNIIHNWRSKYPLLDRFLEQCTIMSEADALKQMQISSQGGVWQASAWFLERKWPSKYGRRDLIKHEVYQNFQLFIKTVLEVINETDPGIRTTIISKLRARKIDFGDQEGLQSDSS